MQIGINWISPHTLPIVRCLIEDGTAHFVELMVDNAAHLHPTKIKQALPDIPISLHIVSSRYLEKDLSSLIALGDYLREWIHELQPLYVSDHLVQFSSDDGRRLPLIHELDYANKREFIIERTIAWQQLLGTTILFENHASLTLAGKDQAAFFADFLRETRSELLFDFSNAFIAEINNVCVYQAWRPLIAACQHFHVAGFRVDPMSKLAIDTHDASLDARVIDLIHQENWAQENKTLVVEFDANMNEALLRNEIARVKEVCQ